MQNETQKSQDQQFNEQAIQPALTPEQGLTTDELIAQGYSADYAPVHPANVDVLTANAAVPNIVNTQSELDSSKLSKETLLDTADIVKIAVSKQAEARLALAAQAEKDRDAAAQRPKEQYVSYKGAVALPTELDQPHK